ncbi:hypothetical protein DXM94_01665 [Salmonella enterica]|nr:hypothetical protein [Salmonella enterica]
MAVENKFKINVIAASVLMGLSLSAMTSAVAADKKEAEVAPAPAKTTLAEVVKAVKPDEVTFDKGEAATNPSQKESLKGLITYLGDNTPSHADGIKSVDHARGVLAEKYKQAAAGTDAKVTAAALQNLVAFNRATAAAMVKLARLQGQVFKSSKIIYIFSAFISEINIAESHLSALAHYFHSTKYHSLNRGPPE